MASIRISQLAEVTTVTNDDVFVVNDGDVNTRKITYSNLVSGLLPLVGDSTITGDLTVTGLATVADLDVASGLLSVDTTNLRVGIGTNAPEQTLDILGNVQIRTGGVLRFNDPNNAYAVTFQSPVLSANTAYAWPNSFPANSGQVLASTDNGVMSWASVFVDPLVVAGDMVVRDAANATSRLPVGLLGQVLTVQGDGVPNWQDPTTGFTDPMTNAGDIIVRDASNATVRLGIGTAGQHLAVNATGTALEWSSEETIPNLNQVATEGASTGVSISVGPLLTVQGDGASADGAIKLNCSQNSHGVTIQAPPHSVNATYTLTLPSTDGNADQVLSTDGSGGLSWVDSVPLSALLTVLGVSSYVDNTAATNAGLAVADIYYNTSSSRLQAVT